MNKKFERSIITAQKHWPDASEEVKLTAAALVCHGLVIDNITENIIVPPKETPELTFGPYIDIEGAGSKELGERLHQTKVGTFEHQIALTMYTIANLLQGKIKLLQLLDEFYMDRTCPELLKLDVRECTAGSSILRCKGSQIVAFRSKPEREEWIKGARAEMQAFADFLIDKL